MEDTLREGKRVEKIRWRAEKGRSFLIVDADSGVCKIFEDNEESVSTLYNAYNYFRTEKQAKEAARRVKETLRKYHEEIGE